MLLRDKSPFRATRQTIKPCGFMCSTVSQRGSSALTDRRTPLWLADPRFTGPDQPRYSGRRGGRRQTSRRTRLAAAVRGASRNRWGTGVWVDCGGLAPVAPVGRCGERRSEEPRRRRALQLRGEHSPGSARSRSPLLRLGAQAALRTEESLRRDRAGRYRRNRYASAVSRRVAPVHGRRAGRRVVRGHGRAGRALTRGHEAAQRPNSRSTCSRWGSRWASLASGERTRTNAAHPAKHPGQVWGGKSAPG